ncbi:MAG: hypothetical protein AAF170_17630, partial [Bacteroidota bacterium]
MIRFVLAASLLSLAAACSDPEPALSDEREGVLASAETLPASTTGLTTTPEPVTADTSSADPETVATFLRIRDAAAAEAVADKPFGEIVQWVGEQLIGRPYAAGLLDAPESETLVIDQICVPDFRVPRASEAHSRRKSTRSEGSEER